MSIVITALLVITSIALTTVILMQGKGGGLGSAFGNAAYQRTRRGADKALFQFTILLAVLFIGLSLANVFLN
jgi:preprotein translocase subunit SecG